LSLLAAEDTLLRVMILGVVRVFSVFELLPESMAPARLAAAVTSDTGTLGDERDRLTVDDLLDF
jgi:hypothetical protein